MDSDIALTDLGGQLSSIHEPTQYERHGTSNQLEQQSDRPEFSLPRADGGKDAWLFLAACFVVEALVWGKIPEVFYCLSCLQEWNFEKRTLLFEYYIGKALDISEVISL